MLDMYPGVAFSPQTSLLSSVSSVATRLYLEDVTVLPAAPTYATLGIGETGEVVKVVAKGATYVDVVRATEGVAKSWDAGTVVARMFTVSDYNALVANITQLFTDMPTGELLATWLMANSWVDNVQVLSLDEVTANCLVQVSPSPSSITAWAESGVYCSAQANGALTFVAATTPTDNIVVYIKIWY